MSNINSFLSFTAVQKQLIKLRTEFKTDLPLEKPLKSFQPSLFPHAGLSIFNLVGQSIALTFTRTARDKPNVSSRIHCWDEFPLPNVS